MLCAPGWEGCSEKNGCMCMYGWVSFFSVHLKLSQHYLLIGYTKSRTRLSNWTELNWYHSESCTAVSHSLQPHGLVHGILQARKLEWVAFPFSRGSSQPRNWTQVSCPIGGFFISWATREALKRGHCGCMGQEMNPGLPCGRQRFYHWITHSNIKSLEKYSVMVYMGKESIKSGHMYIYNWFTLLYSRN